MQLIIDFGVRVLFVVLVVVGLFSVVGSCVRKMEPVAIIKMGVNGEEK